MQGTPRPSAGPRLLGRIAMLLLASAIAQPVTAQKKKDKAPSGDPYTAGKKAALAKAGYVRLGPFPFGGKHTTGDVDALLGKRVAWIETAHFRLGCQLSPLKIKTRAVWGKEWNASLKGELAGLKKILPGIKKPKVLDPWLRTHLFARRLETLYDEVSANLALGRKHGKVEKADGGPFLGMSDKGCILLLQKNADHARYTRAYHGREMGDPIRHYDGHLDCMYWGAGEETAQNLFANDFALHTHLVYNVAHNLYSGYRTGRRPLPAWLVTGLCHWHARQVSPRFPTHDRPETVDGEGSKHSAFWEWEKRIGGLVKNGVFKSLDTLMNRPTSNDFGVEDHMHVWSLVAFLTETRKAELFYFVHQLKGSGITQQAAFEKAFGCSISELEAAWQTHYTSKKRRRRR